MLIMWWRMSGDASEVRGRGCKRLCTLDGGTCGMHTSGTGGRARVFCCCCVLRRLYFSIRVPPGVCGGQGVQAPLYSRRRRRLWYAYKRRAGTRNLFLHTSALVSSNIHFSRCVGGAGGTSASLLSAAVLAVYIQAGRECGHAGFGFVLRPLYFSIYIPPGVCEGQGVQALFYSRRRRF